MNLNDIFLRIIIFVIIILLGLIVSKVISNLIKKGIKEFELNKIFRKADIKFNPEKFFPSVIKYLIYLFVLIIAFNAVDITTIVLKIFVIIVILIIISYVLISIKDLIPNVYYNFKVKKKYKVGNKIKYKNIQGEIIHMNLVELQVKTKKEVVYIPYKLLR